MMAHYKDLNNEIHFLDNTDYEYLLPQGCVQITDEEANNIRLTKITPEEKVKQLSDAIQLLLDTTAQSFRYDNIMSARSYTGYTNPFQTEALKLADWSAACWNTAGEIEIAVLNGTRSIPTIEEVLAELPVFV